MNEEFRDELSDSTTGPQDSLEAEMASLRPMQLSPGLRKRIDAQMPGASADGWRFHGRMLLIAGGVLAAAACLVIAIGRMRTPPVHHDPAPVVKRTDPQVSDPGAGQFSVAAYRHAYQSSPASLDSLLDEQAAAWAVEAPEARSSPIAHSSSL